MWKQYINITAASDYDELKVQLFTSGKRGVVLTAWKLQFDYKFFCELSNFGYLYLLCDLIQNSKFNANWITTNERGETIILFYIGTLKCN